MQNQDIRGLCAPERGPDPRGLARALLRELEALCPGLIEQVAAERQLARLAVRPVARPDRDRRPSPTPVLSEPLHHNRPDDVRPKGPDFRLPQGRAERPRSVGGGRPDIEPACLAEREIAVPAGTAS